MHFSSKSVSKLLTTDKDLQDIFLEAIKYSPIDFGISHGLRSAEEQNELYQQGRTKPGNIVTNVDGYTRRSKHQDGIAIDVFAWVDGKVSWEEKYYWMIAGVVLWVAQSRNIKLQWGGHWKSFKDYPHFELIQ